MFSLDIGDFLGYFFTIISDIALFFNLNNYVKDYQNYLKIMTFFLLLLSKIQYYSATEK